MSFAELQSKALRGELNFAPPHKPEWIDRELEALGASRSGLPLFRCVWGGEATEFAAGHTRIKYPFIDPKGEKKTIYRRFNLATNEFRVYEDYRQAVSDLNPHLMAEIIPETLIEILETGYPYWIIEIHEQPDERDWNENRFSMEFNDLTSRMELVDMLGNYPRKGKYRMLFLIADEQGDPTSPNRQTIQEIKRRIRAVEEDKRSFMQRVKDKHQIHEAREEQAAAQLADNALQSFAFMKTKLTEGNAVSRPVTKVHGENK